MKAEPSFGASRHTGSKMVRAARVSRVQDEISPVFRLL